MKHGSRRDGAPVACSCIKTVSSPGLLLVHNIAEVYMPDCPALRFLAMHMLCSCTDATYRVDPKTARGPISRIKIKTSHP